jgi:hypothetical protein
MHAAAMAIGDEGKYRIRAKEGYFLKSLHQDCVTKNP